MACVCLSVATRFHSHCNISTGSVDIARDCGQTRILRMASLELQSLTEERKMAAETLNFGPEWLRALSSGGSVTSPPPSPAMPKYKLAEYRYGREEMLALYVKENKFPEEMQDKEFAAILQEEPLQPLALVPLTEEEQRNFSMSVNSVAVLRLMGKGGAVIPGGVARGRGTTRGGRGRGRGDGSFYQRSIEDGEVGFSRSGREIHRSQSWDDRGERRFEKPIRRDAVRVGFEEVAAPGVRKEYTRSDSENWRTLREEQEEEEAVEGGGSSWRLAGVRRDDGGPRSAGWREHVGERRRKFDFDFREHGEERGPRRLRVNSEGFEEDRDGLPEWCMDDEDDEMGTFDSSGAFMSLKKSSKDLIPEEQELEFQAVEEEEEHPEGRKDSRESGSEPERKDAPEKDGQVAAAAAVCVLDSAVNCPTPPSPPTVSVPPGQSSLSPGELETPLSARPDPLDPAPPAARGIKLPSEECGSLGVVAAQLSPGTSSTLSSSSSPPSSSAAIHFTTGGDNEDEDGMSHLQQEAEKMVASLQENSLEEERFTQTMRESRNTAAALPLSHEAAMKWFYKDPQGEIQGPFTTQEMAEWFQAGYFTMTLLVKRGCDEGFQPLGEVIKMWGRVPFAPGPSPPPLLGNMDQERLKKQQELAAAALYQQLQQQQLFQLINRCGEQGLIPPINRSMSVPDTGSLWDMHTSASQQPGSEASSWDLTMNSSTQGPILEQLQLERQKLQQERRDAELRAKREEEERKRREEKQRRLEAEQKRREEEELFRRKQCRQQQELIMKLLQQQQQQQQGPSVSSVWSNMPKQGKTLLELQQETERQLQKQRGGVQRSGHGGLGLSGGNVSSMAGQWGNDQGTMWGAGGGGGHEGKNSSMGMWDEALKSQGSGLRNLGLKSSRSSPSLRRKTEEEEKLLKMLQGMRPQDGFTTWSEQMLHALNSNTSTSNLDVSSIVSYLKEVESPYEVHDFIRSYLGDTLEAKEFAKQFLERPLAAFIIKLLTCGFLQLSKEMAGLTMNFPLQDAMRGLNPSSLQAVFQSNHCSSKQAVYESEPSSKMKKQQHLGLHSDPSILGYSFHNPSDRMNLSEIEPLEDY
ncbi:GRB10-interacting GYF protein 1-like [Acipenser oxyrinchus oxyrinchus]|uniref:GRB10-interacting GYF protein 1-like n=1 Tax=Acipenser oxyrinchus oxyrinchus TaxID=40147 RepID=A0AAD8FVN9_ACIOX|nr:GRB10-interacting GYF protein 1-like [Acipenser oxyrinchus oxyrinchus]